MAFSSSEDEDAPRTYQIEYAEIAEVELEKAYLWLSEQIGPVKAARWAEEVKTTVESLRLYPHRFIAVPSRSGARRVLVGKFHVLYRIIEPTAEETEGLVRILNIYHAASERAQ